MFNALFCFLAANFGTKVLFSLWNKDRKPDDLEHVGYVSTLYIHPLKSARGITLDSGTCLDQGFKHHQLPLFDRLDIFFWLKPKQLTI